MGTRKGCVGPFFMIVVYCLHVSLSVSISQADFASGYSRAKHAKCTQLNVLMHQSTTANVVEVNKRGGSSGGAHGRGTGAGHGNGRTYGTGYGGSSSSYTHGSTTLIPVYGRRAAGGTHHRSSGDHYGSRVDRTAVVVFLIIISLSI